MEIEREVTVKVECPFCLKKYEHTQLVTFEIEPEDLKVDRD